MSHHDPEEASASSRLAPTYLSFSKQVVMGMAATAIIGGLAAIGGATLYTDGLRRIMLAYLVALTFVLSLSLGSLFFLLVQHLTRAGWAVMIRRPAEVFAMNVITVAVLALPILWTAHSGMNSIYPWARVSQVEPHAAEDVHGSAELPSAGLRPVALQADGPIPQTVSTSDAPTAVHEHEGNYEPRAHLYVHQTFDELTASKTTWLNPAAFSLRLVLYFAVWTGLAAFYFRSSRRLDETGAISNTLQMERWAGPAAFAFALTLTFASFDLLMSLDPHWYSTIFGVYYFSGCAVGGFAVSLLSWLVLSQVGKLPVGIAPAHLRDLGRLLFAFTFFWGYIAFSQYMLLWYANIPETTRWWAVRGASLADGLASSWGLVLVLLLFGHFILPFLGIMSRHVKDDRRAMIFWTIWMLVMHYFDLYWLVMPELRGSIAFGLPEIGTLMLVGSLYAIGASYFATRTTLVPIGDPRLSASIGLSDAY